MNCFGSVTGDRTRCAIAPSNTRPSHQFARGRGLNSHPGITGAGSRGLLATTTWPQYVSAVATAVAAVVIVRAVTGALFLQPFASAFSSLIATRQVTDTPSRARVRSCSPRQRARLDRVNEEHDFDDNQAAGGVRPTRCPSVAFVVLYDRFAYHDRFHRELALSVRAPRATPTVANADPFGPADSGLREPLPPARNERRRCEKRPLPSQHGRAARRAHVLQAVDGGRYRRERRQRSSYFALGGRAPRRYEPLEPVVLNARSATCQ